MIVIIQTFIPLQRIEIMKLSLAKNTSAADNVLFIDDFMANGEACLGAIRVLKEAQATICGIGIVIEKAFQSGRKQVQALGYDVYAQARIASLKNGTIVFAE